MRASTERGMTLIEIMIVLVLIALVASAVGVMVIDRFRDGQVKAAERQVRNISGSVQQYLISNGDCPSLPTSSRSASSRRSRAIPGGRRSSSVARVSTTATAPTSSHQGPTRRRGPTTTSAPGSGDRTDRGYLESVSALERA